MDLKECYNIFGGNYNNVIVRLITEERVKKFLFMFLKDTSFNELESAMKCSDYKSAFRAAHTLKGVCANLGIEKLGKVSSEITEALRAKDNDTADRIFPQVSQYYSKTIDAINQLDQNESVQI
ncbi:MAG TPA: Hpt domain-containing protein [Ruminococcaceae bacterium]|nr:Hpt domain-containing protein [Oscillospiraceae bacterium]